MDERQLDLLDWLESQPVETPKKPRLKAVVVNSDVDEDQLDLVELIKERAQAA